MFAMRTEFVEINNLEIAKKVIRNRKLWSYAKRRLQKSNGISKTTFYLYLKECE